MKGALRIILAIALALFTSPCYGQAVTQTGAVKSPGNIPLDLSPTTQFLQSCNSGAGGIVGQTYNTVVCGPTINASSPSVGATGSAVPAQADQVGGVGPSGNLRALCVDTTGVLCSPQATTTQRTITHTNLASNTSTTICPAATNPVTIELFFTTAGVGINLQGGTLTQATVGASTTTTPNIVIGTANTYYLAPVAVSNAITAYGAAGYVVCIQTTRQ